MKKPAKKAKAAKPVIKAMPEAKMSTRDINMTSKGVPRLAASSGKGMKGFGM